MKLALLGLLISCGWAATSAASPAPFIPELRLPDGCGGTPMSSLPALKKLLAYAPNAQGDGGAGLRLFVDLGPHPSPAQVMQSLGLQSAEDATKLAIIRSRMANPTGFVQAGQLDCLEVFRPSILEELNRGARRYNKRDSEEIYILPPPEPPRGAYIQIQPHNWVGEELRKGRSPEDIMRELRELPSNPRPVGPSKPSVGDPSRSSHPSPEYDPNAVSPLERAAPGAVQ